MDQRFSISRIVLAVFHKSMLMKDSFNIAVEIKNSLNDIFINSPMMLPGVAAPPEIPRVVFKNENGLELQVAQNVTSLQLNILSEDPSDKILYGFQGIGSKVIDLVNEKFECGITRIGFVLIGNFSLETKASEFVKDTYLQDFNESLFGNEVHWLTRPVLGGEMINRWVRIKSIADPNGVSGKYLEITIDSNTMLENERAVSGDFAKDYLKMCVNDLHDNFNAITKINL